MSTSNKNVESMNWQEVPDAELGWDEADPKDISLAKLQEKYQCKWVQEAEEVKKHQEVEEAEKRVHEAEEAKKRREAEQQREAKKQEAKRAKEAKKWQHAESKARPSGAQGPESKCMQCTKASTMCIMGLGTKQKVACDWCSHNKEKCEWPVTEIGSAHGVTSPQGGEKKKRLWKAQTVDDDNDDDNNEVMVSACKAGKSETGVRETMVQIVDRRMGEIVAELQGLRKGMSDMAKANQDLAWVLYQGFQSINTLVDEVKILGAEGYLPKPALESEASEDKLQETLQEVKELQEEHLEWAMECLQMRKEWMWQEEAALTKHLKGKGKEPAKEKEQEEEEQGTRGEGGEGVAA
ncbi:hypothetical protein ID866_9934 [Astraeus odoratus]|nr:hypothetical protein ID866_9934 [Astraeus odoratus]